MIMAGMRLLAAVLAILAASIAMPAAAHLTPNSEIVLQIGENAAVADIIVPQGEYRYATGLPVGNDAVALARAEAYLLDHMRVEARDGRPWSIAVRQLRFEQVAGPPDLRAVAELTPPPGESPRMFELNWRAVVEEIPSHFALVVIAGDATGRLGNRREVLGALRAGSTRLRVDRGAGSVGIAFANAMLVGVHHILEGYDHLLFLLMLLLPASLVARGGRWRDHRSPRATAAQLVRIVTAFTVGHSLTLIGASLGQLSLPTAPVEVAIAVSVLLSALHAIRPIVPGCEPLVALSFGLIHGLAFATLLTDAGADMTSGATSLIGFNLGIEAAQLAVVALVLPPLVLILRDPAFASIRIAAAAFAALAALAWIVQRTIGVGGQVVQLLETGMAQAPWMLPVLYGLATICLIRRRAAPTEAAAIG